MTFTLDAECTTGLTFDYETLYQEAVMAALSYLQCPYEASVNLLLTDDAGIREINRENRKIDAATDVLSFPMSDYPDAGDFTHLEELPDAFDPDSGELLLGDIVLSVAHVASNAREYGHSKEREYAFLIVHSMLHLTGFDHIEEADRIRMESAQKEIMKTLGIERA